MPHRPASAASSSPRIVLCLGLALLAACLFAVSQSGLRGADLPPETNHPTGFRPRVVAIQGAKLVTAPGQIMEDGTLVIRDGTIVAVGKDVVIPVGAEVILGKGLVVYPGFIDAMCEAKIKPNSPSPEAGRVVSYDENLVAATRPDNRRGMTPEFEVGEHALRDAEFQAARRKAGITDVHLVHFAPIAGGQTALVSLSGLPDRESVLWSGGMCSFLLGSPPEQGPPHTNYPSTLMGATAHLRQALLDAAHYREHLALAEKFPAQISPPHEDPVLDALSQVLDKQLMPLFLIPHFAGRDELDRALDFSREFKLDPVLCMGTEPIAALDRIAASECDVIVSLDLGEKPKFSVKDMHKDKDHEPKVSAVDGLRVEVETPQRFQDDRIDHWKQRAAFPGQLAAKGVRIAFSSKGLKQPGDWLEQVRLYMEHGLTEDQAVAGLTQHAAEILGVESQLGTLESGKRGHVVVLSGPLSDKGAKVRYVLLDGLTYEFNKPKASDDKDATPPAAQLTGQWDMKIESGKQPTEATLDLAQDGNRLTGTLSSEAGEGRIASGTISGKDVKFTVEIGAGDKTIELKFVGTVDEQTQLSGMLESAFGAPAKWSATRTGRGNETPQEDVAKPGEKPEAATGVIQLKLDESDPEPKTEKQKAAKGPKTDDQAKTDPIMEDDESMSTKPGSGSSDTEKATQDRTKIAPDYPTELESDRLPKADPTGGNVLIRGGTLFTGTGEVLENASLLIENGKIKAIGPDLAAPEGIRIIEAKGRFIIPGLIDTHSHIMIEGGVNEHTQSVVCEVRIKDTVRSNDVLEYRALAGGVTTARLLHGSANTIGGQDAVVKLKVGQTAREHLFEAGPQGVKFALGENVKRKGGRFPSTRLGVEAVLQRAFFEALDYRRRWMEHEREKKAQGDQTGLLPPRRDLRLEELVDIIEHRTLIHSHCYRADEILMLLRTSEGLGIRVQSLQHVLEGYKIAPEIAKHGASCSTFADWWAYKIEAYDATPFNTSMLHDAGINTVVKSDDAELIRQMNLEAAKSLKYGNMPVQDALQMVTRNPARELGIQSRVGTLEVGKDGDVTIYNGHPFSPFSRVEMTLIEGEIRFQRDKHPTAMTAKGLARTAKVAPLTLAPAEVRAKKLELPAGLMKLPYVIVGATIHPVDKPDIVGGSIVVRNGKIEAVLAGPGIPMDVQVIDATGLHVYPGLIDAGTTLGISEIEQIDATQDAAEIGKFQPDLRAGIAVNVESELVEVARAGGITSAFLRPTGGIIGGQCSLIQTAGWTPEEMVRNYTAGLSLNWPEDDEGQQRLARFLKECRLYDAARSHKETADTVLRDPRYEAMRPYVTGKKRIFIEAHNRQQIAGALVWAEEEKLKIVITGGTDAWKLASELKSRKVPVIVGPVMRAPIENWDPYDAPYANPGRLFETGVQFCIRSDNASNSRNAPLEAARAVAFGLPESEALKSVTLHAARILGIDKECGSITPGKRADLLITDGSPLQTTTQIKGTIVNGQPFAPQSRQTRLYEKYRARLAPKE
jgi:imidazolonepropionase-like amidohydrolase